MPPGGPTRGWGDYLGVRGASSHFWLIPREGVRPRDHLPCKPFVRVAGPALYGGGPGGLGGPLPVWLVLGGLWHDLLLSDPSFLNLIHHELPFWGGI